MASENFIPSYGLRPQFIVDNESDRSTLWGEGVTIFCKDTNKFYILIGGAYKEITTAGSGVDHSALTNLTYAAAGHTGFEPAVTKYDLAGTTNQITLSASGTGTLFARSITLSLPQDIATASSPTFANITDNGLTASKVVFTTAGKVLTSTGIGTSSQFIKGDGSLDSSTYLTSAVHTLTDTNNTVSGLTAGNILRATGATTYGWTTATYPTTTTAYKMLVSTGTSVIGELAAVGATGEYLAGATGAIPSWATLNQAAVAGLTTLSSPSFTGLTLSGLTASKVVFTDGSKALTSTGIGTSSQFIKGDGSLDSSTYLTSLSGALLATGATIGATSQSQVFTNGVTLSNLTSGRVTYATTNGLLTDSANFTYNGTNVVQQGNGSVFYSVVAASDTVGYYPYVSFNKSRGTLASSTDVAAADITGAFNSYGWQNSTWASTASIAFFVESVSGNYLKGGASFYVSDGSTGGANIEAFRVLSSKSTFYKLIQSDLSATSGVNEGLRFSYENAINSGVYISAKVNDNGAETGRIEHKLLTGAKGYWAFYTYTGAALTEKMRIDGDGNVGIGNTAPDSLLSVGTNRVSVLPTEHQAIINTNFGGANGTGGRDTLILSNGGTDPTTTILGSALSFKSPTYGSTGSWSSGRILSYFDTSGGSNPGYAGGILALQYPTADNAFATGLVLRNGNVGIGVTVPTAVLHLKAGTATASTAPLKFTSGTLLTTPEAGVVEFLTDKFYGTITTGAVRHTFATLESAAQTFSNDISVPDEVYGAGWDGSLEVPTKNAVYDKIETLSGGVTEVAWTDYGGTSTVVGWSSTTTKLIYYKKIGKTVCIAYDIRGTSNATNVTFTLPYASAAGVQFDTPQAHCVDNGTTFSPAGMINLPASSSTATIYSTNNTATGAFTASGTKEVRGQFWYEAAS